MRLSKSLSPLRTAKEGCRARVNRAPLCMCTDFQTVNKGLLLKRFLEIVSELPVYSMARYPNMVPEVVEPHMGAE